LPVSFSVQIINISYRIVSYPLVRAFVRVLLTRCLRTQWTDCHQTLLLVM